MKRTVALFLAILLVLAMCVSTSAAEQNETQIRLSELSEEECIAFIKSRGLQIPDTLANYSSLGTFIKNIIVTIEEDPHYQFVINYPVTYEFANQIKALVNDYYGVTREAMLVTRATSAYTLQYSTVYGNWLDEYYGYNCYSYAIGQTRPYDGFYIWHYPGCFNTETAGNFSLDMPVAEMADRTASDLNTLGYSCVKYEANYSSIIAYADSHSIICLRKCSTPGLEDYHYMKLSGNMWLHKLGDTHPLKLNALPSQSTWYNEWASPEGIEHEGNRYYTGDIYYFAYTENHSYTSGSYTGNNYHSGQSHYYEFARTCACCGEVERYWDIISCAGPPCLEAYALTFPGETE